MRTDIDACSVCAAGFAGGQFAAGHRYDALNRLTQGVGFFGQNQALVTHDYSYNAIGNILNKGGVAFTYGDAMHPSAVTSISSGKTYSYDANGNMATGGNRTFIWDFDNRVTSVTVGGSTTSMQYDYTGTRVRKDGFGGISLYPFQGYEIDPNGVITKFVKIGIETFASKRGSSKYFYHNDHLGSVNVITDINGARVQLNEYDPWGGVSRTEGSIDPTHRFTGKELDPETGLYYYGGRYYDPEISRFISAVKMKIFYFAAAVILFSSPAFAQQRVIVEKATGNVVDVGDSTLQYDTRYFDNLSYPTSPIPGGADVRKYMRDASGAIVLRPKDELTKNFDDEGQSDLAARITGSNLSAELKALLIDIVKNLRR